MKTLNLFMGLAFCALGAAGCGDDDGETTTPDGGGSNQADGGTVAKNVDVTDNITADTTWKADTTYHLKQKASSAEGGPYIFVKAPATLTVEAGTHVVGAEGTALVIGRGAKIQAVGTASNPIVFSHDAPVGSRESGKWGGIVILGAAPHNVVTGADTPFEAFNNLGGIGNFGGSNAADNSGTLKYVQIQFAGFAYTTNREFNGLTLCGVGSGTTIDFVQIHRGSDDGVEFFGGTVNVKHLVIDQNQDDGFDTDNGYSGKAQFIVIQDIEGNTSDGSHGYESDNSAMAADFDRTPRTSPTVYNATLIGKQTTSVPHFGAIWRRGTSGHYFNQIITGFKSAAIEVRDAATVAQTVGATPALAISSSVIFGNATNWGMEAANDVLDEQATWATANGNLSTDPGMPTAMTSTTSPSFKPAAKITGGATPPNDGFFDTTATFIGAIGDTDWTTGWTAYPLN